MVQLGGIKAPGGVGVIQKMGSLHNVHYANMRQNKIKSISGRMCGAMTAERTHSAHYVKGVAHGRAEPADHTIYARAAIERATIKFALGISALP